MLSTLPFLGEFCSISCALLWALAVVFFRRAGQGMTPFQLNLFKNLVGTLLFMVTLPAIGQTFFPSQVKFSEWIILAISGLCGMAIADLFFFKSLQILGATLSAIVGTLYSPFMILLAVIFLGETPHITLLIGSILVLGAIAIGSWEPTALKDLKKEGQSPRRILFGILLAVTYIILMVGSIIPIKPLLNREGLSITLWACWFRILSGTVSMIFLAPFEGGLKGMMKAFHPSKHMKWVLLGSIVGTWLVPALWFLGLKLIPLSRASVLNEMYLIFIFILAAIMLGEPFTKRRGFAIALAFTGAVLAMS